MQLCFLPVLCASLQEVLIALNDKHCSLTKRPSLSPDDIKDVPHALVKLMQQCWHKVSPYNLSAAAHLDHVTLCDYSNEGIHVSIMFLASCDIFWYCNSSCMSLIAVNHFGKCCICSGSMSWHDLKCGTPMQNPAIRPSFDIIKSALTTIANETFNCSLENASQMRRARQQALLNQMLPSKVHMHCWYFCLCCCAKEQDAVREVKNLLHAYLKQSLCMLDSMSTFIATNYQIKD